ncbi:MAG: hypothetical protein RL198_655 [Actinomycetota bacterium]
MSAVASEGFEPPKAEPADLQSDPFGRLGNSPRRLRRLQKTTQSQRKPLTESKAENLCL